MLLRAVQNFNIKFSQSKAVCVRDMNLIYAMGTYYTIKTCSQNLLCILFSFDSFNRYHAFSLFFWTFFLYQINMHHVHQETRQTICYVAMEENWNCSPLKEKKIYFVADVDAILFWSIRSTNRPSKSTNREKRAKH